jgi:hypothetical protein
LENAFILPVTPPEIKPGRSGSIQSSPPGQEGRPKAGVVILVKTGSGSDRVSIPNPPSEFRNWFEPFPHALLSYRHTMQQFSFRKVLILVVLAGLIFSCAEGIRLLPFPPPGVMNGGDSFRPSAAGTAHLSYIKSFESGRNSVRFAGTHFLGSAGPASIPPFRAAFGPPDVSLTFTPVSHSSRFTWQLRGPRGPPVFFSI